MTQPDRSTKIRIGQAAQDWIRKRTHIRRPAKASPRKTSPENSLPRERVEWTPALVVIAASVPVLLICALAVKLSYSMGVTDGVEGGKGNSVSTVTVTEIITANATVTKSVTRTATPKQHRQSRVTVTAQPSRPVQNPAPTRTKSAPKSSLNASEDPFPEADNPDTNSNDSDPFPES
ncbi:hypothetical protein [Spongiactinospora sp. TRM90649]|uniref:hypothetical protein n=1 Tax=Spongiactinospora sp. TRM90649 TaxID=3031114 RepID=UPI0023F72712|nr:hypothetical protein [Spongiactinospora sp. TRM90649]MDF5752957.1 hypothetical protein [Spongiactinospora sp. TRM90649]